MFCLSAIHIFVHQLNSTIIEIFFWFICLLVFEIRIYETKVQNQRYISAYFANYFFFSEYEICCCSNSLLTHKSEILFKKKKKLLVLNTQY